MHAQLANFLQAEVDGIEPAVCAGAPGEALCHVGGLLQVDIVQHQGHAVRTEHHVLLDKIRPHDMRHRLGGEGVFRQVAAGPAVGDNEGL